MKNALIIFMVLATFGMTAQNKSLEKKGTSKGNEIQSYSRTTS